MPSKRQRRKSSRKRYRRKKKQDSAWTEEMDVFFRYYFKACILCGRKKNLSKDHIIPLAKKGCATIDNIICLCRYCNSRKGSKLPKNLPDDEAAIILEESLKFQKAWENRTKTNSIED